MHIIYIYIYIFISNIYPHEFAVFSICHVSQPEATRPHRASLCWVWAPQFYAVSLGPGFGKFVY